MSCPVVWDKKNLLLGKYINFNCTCNFKSSLAQWPRVKVSHPLTKSIINNLKQEGALGKQNVTAACPKDKLEFIFFFRAFWGCALHVARPGGSCRLTFAPGKLEVLSAFHSTPNSRNSGCYIIEWTISIWSDQNIREQLWRWSSLTGLVINVPSHWENCHPQYRSFESWEEQ